VKGRVAPGSGRDRQGQSDLRRHAGIAADNSFPVDFLCDNLALELSQDECY